MFGEGHLIFIFISIILVIIGVAACRRIKPPLMQLIGVCFILSVVLELVKFFSVMEIVPVVVPVTGNGVLSYAETGSYTPYIRAEHLPFELCSLQILFFFLALVIKDEKWRKRVLSVIYGTALTGGVTAVLLSSIAPQFGTAAEFLSSVRAWEFYLYHALIIIAAICIGLDGECGLRFSDSKWMFATVLFFDISSLYLNSILSEPVYRGKELEGIMYAVNFFSSYNNPLGIPMTGKPQYLLYLLLRFCIASALIVLVYLPFRLRDRRRR